MEGFIIHIRENRNVEESKHQLISMLEDLLSNDPAQIKKENLYNKYGMIMNYETEGRMHDMCNLSELVEARGMERGIENCLINLVKKGMLSIENAAAEIGISKAEFEAKIASTSETVEK